MQTKTLIAIAAAVAFLWFFEYEPARSFVRPVPAAERQGEGIATHEFEALFNAGRSLASLSRDGVYTVVEVYINTCAICRRIEARFPDLISERSDLVVQRVHFPERGLVLSGDDLLAINARMESYRICGTPHVEVYGPDGRLVAGDDCGDKQGLKFLRHWIAAETGASLTSL